MTTLTVDGEYPGQGISIGGRFSRHTTLKRPAIKDGVAEESTPCSKYARSSSRSSIEGAANEKCLSSEPLGASSWVRCIVARPDGYGLPQQSEDLSGQVLAHRPNSVESCYRVLVVALAQLL